MFTGLYSFRPILIYPLINTDLSWNYAIELNQELNQELNRNCNEGYS